MSENVPDAIDMLSVERWNALAQRLREELGIPQSAANVLTGAICKLVDARLEVSIQKLKDDIEHASGIRP